MDWNGGVSWFDHLWCEDWVGIANEEPKPIRSKAKPKDAMDSACWKTMKHVADTPEAG